MGTVITGGKGSRDQAGSGVASGAFSHAEGLRTKAPANYGGHAEGADTTASGDSSHAEGDATTASGAGSHAEGWSTQATASQAHAEGGSTQATAQRAHAEGYNTLASGTNSHAEGDGAQATGYGSHAEGSATRATGISTHAEGRNSLANHYGQHAKANGQFLTQGDAQYCRYVARQSTADATAKLLTFDEDTNASLVFGSGNGLNVLTVPVNRLIRFTVNVVARRTDVTGDMAGWRFDGVIGRGSSGNAAFIGTVDSRAWGSTGAAAWDVTLSVNTSNATNNYLAITATGEAAKTIRWVATIETTEVS